MTKRSRHIEDALESTRLCGLIDIALCEVIQLKHSTNNVGHCGLERSIRCLNQAMKELDGWKEHRSRYSEQDLLKE